MGIQGESILKYGFSTEESSVPADWGVGGGGAEPLGSLEKKKNLGSSVCAKIYKLSLKSMVPFQKRNYHPVNTASVHPECGP